jgi:xanthine dehydrogenase YagS FAD-binding subunit
LRPFRYVKPASAADALHYGAEANATFIAGGTELLNLLKDGLVTADLLVDVNDALAGGLQWSDDGLRIAAGTHMRDLAVTADVRRRLPLLTDALLASASGQVREMATIGGNLLQRTRCWYFRDPVSACNVRSPGSGCPAISGQNRWNAVFGGSDACVRVHPSDLAVALTALDADVLIAGPSGERRTAIGDFYHLPGGTPAHQNALEHGELITAVQVPLPEPNRSTYVKARDRASFEFALVSLAATAQMRGATVHDTRLVFGGVAPTPWRIRAAEDVLNGRPLTDATIEAAAAAAIRGAKPLRHNGFKIELMRRILESVLTGWRAHR